MTWARGTPSRIQIKINPHTHVVYSTVLRRAPRRTPSSVRQDPLGPRGSAHPSRIVSALVLTRVTSHIMTVSYSSVRTYCSNIFSLTHFYFFQLPPAVNLVATTSLKIAPSTQLKWLKLTSTGKTSEHAIIFFFTLSAIRTDRSKVVHVRLISSPCEGSPSSPRRACPPLSLLFCRASSRLRSATTCTQSTE